MYANRKEAGEQLAAALSHRRDPQLLVLGLPRGGVVVAAEIARVLDAQLDVLVCKKVRAPGNPELALGAVSEDGKVYVNQEIEDQLDVSERYLEQEKQQRLAEMARQVELYRAVRPKVPMAGRPVILADDGLATGATMIASIHSAALNQPRSILVAVPGGARETAEKIRSMEEVGELICLETPGLFYGVGQLYDDFAQVEDDE